ncbi:hypothetical protein Tco_1469212 [Tanacetum coccineum]
MVQKSSDEDDDDNEQTKSDNDGEDFVHPKFSTHDEEERQEEEDKEEEGSDLRVQTPSHFESTDDEAYNEVTQGDNVEGEELNEEEINEEDEVNELYRDVNVNLERRDTKMTDALQTNVQGTQVIEDTHVIITDVTPEVQHQSSSVSSGFISNMLNLNPDTSIDSILNLNTESTSLVDVPVTTNVEMPPSSATTLPPPPIPLIQPLQQTPFEDRVKALEDNFSKFKQTNLFAEAVSSIPGIVDTYLANKINEAKIIKEQVKAQVKEQVSKILPKIEKTVNEQLEAEVLTRSSNEAKTSHTFNRRLSTKHWLTLMKLTKSYLKHMEMLSRLNDVDMMRMKTKNPLLDQTRGSKRRRAGKEPELTSAPKEKTSNSTGKSKEGSKSHQAKEPTHIVDDLEEPTHQEFDIGFTEYQPVDETTQLPDLFQKPAKPPTPDRDSNKTLLADHGPIQP